MSNLGRFGKWLVAASGLFACGHAAPPVAAAAAATELTPTELAQPKATPTSAAASTPSSSEPSRNAEEQSVVPAIILELQAQFQEGTGTMVDAKRSTRAFHADRRTEPKRPSPGHAYEMNASCTHMACTAYAPSLRRVVARFSLRLIATSSPRCQRSQRS